LRSLIASAAALTLCGSAAAQEAPTAAALPSTSPDHVSPWTAQRSATGAIIETPVGGQARRASAAPVVELNSKRVMAVGEVVTIGLTPIARIAIGNGAVVKAAVVDAQQLVLLGQAAGDTTVHVWLKSGKQITYTVEVRPVRYEQLMADVSDLLKDVQGVHVRLVGDRVVLEGRYPDTEAATKIKALTDSFPQLLNLIPSKPADADPLRLERMVQLNLRVVEVKKRALEQLGINWASTADGPTFATNVLGYANTPWRPDNVAQNFPPVNTHYPAATYFGLATQITSALNMLEQRGDAWTLAEPRLSCRSGGESKFVAGGEIPIPVPQGNGSIGVTYKQYGVVIDFKPIADGGGNVESKIQVEVSDPDPRNSNQGYIAFTTDRAETEVAIKEGEPLVIAGLFRDLVDKSTTGIPGLSRIPVLSYLFGAHDTRTEQTELFIVVTPHVVTPDSVLNKTGVERSDTLSKEIRDRGEDDLKPNAPLETLPDSGPSSAAEPHPPVAFPHP
jgi:pilus assembly protein CpaC